MAGKSNIEWTGHSWNPLAGCTVVTPGCSSCYAMKLAPRLARMGQPLYEGLTKETKGGAVWTGEIRRAAESVLLAPLKRKKPTTYFVNSMSDLFHEFVPDEWIIQIFAVMAASGQHTYQILTKRAERMQRIVSLIGKSIKPLEAAAREIGYTLMFEGKGLVQWPLPNVWLGVSTEDQKRADERIPLLLQTPAAIRFISAEPLLGPINLDRIHEGFDTPEGARIDMWESCLDGKRYDMWAGDDEDPMQGGHPKLDWVIVGGESGHGFRKMDPAWAEAILAQCKSAGTAVFMKQMSGRAPIPPLMQIRQFPKTLTS